LGVLDNRVGTIAIKIKRDAGVKGVVRLPDLEVKVGAR
jgi:hypothetical protein